MTLILQVFVGKYDHYCMQLYTVLQVEVGRDNNYSV